MSDVLSSKDVNFDAHADIVIIGAGACGLTAALAASDRGAEVLILERDAVPSGSTALSSGFIPAAGTRYQAALGIDDNRELFAKDIQAKAKGQALQNLTDLVAGASGPALEWLADAHGLEWVVLDEFLYPGHSRHRMHATPERTGEGLLSRLVAAVERTGIPIAVNSHVTGLYVNEHAIKGVQVNRPGGLSETISCKALVLACNGYGGNRELIAKHIPEMSDALYFGHAGNQGDAVLWGEKLGARSEHLSAYQGHGSVAHPHAVLITWALIMEGAVQVNADGERFSNEHGGYSEQAVHVLAQPERIAWCIYDERLHELGLGFEDYRTADEMGAILSAPDAESLAKKTGLPGPALSKTLQEVHQLAIDDSRDVFGRRFSKTQALEAPFYAVKVTGAVFHTQGGLVIDSSARVVDAAGHPFSNLFAAGGAACGVSGPDVSGYLSGNGLLTAIAYGKIAGKNAPQLV
ncbi:MAG: FAD-dependent oxidoreductase [Hyphomicrobiales bacterium]